VLLNDRNLLSRARQKKPRYNDIKFYEVMESMFSKLDESSLVKAGYESIVNPLDPHDT
jgi:hypothetical protein